MKDPSVALSVWGTAVWLARAIFLLTLMAYAEWDLIQITPNPNDLDDAKEPRGTLHETHKAQRRLPDVTRQITIGPLPAHLANNQDAVFLRDRGLNADINSIAVNTTCWKHEFDSVWRVRGKATGARKGHHLVFKQSDADWNHFEVVHFHSTKMTYDPYLTMLRRRWMSAKRGDIYSGYFD